MDRTPTKTFQYRHKKQKIKTRSIRSESKTNFTFIFSKSFTIKKSCKKSQYYIPIIDSLVFYDLEILKLIFYFYQLLYINFLDCQIKYKIAILIRGIFIVKLLITQLMLPHL